MQEFITIRLPKEEYSQLIAKSVQLDFLRSDYDFLNRQYEDMCDRYAELRKDYTEQIQSCIRL
ncbi:chordopoxvirus fusion protein, partial [Staphylococcus caprae]